MAINYRNVPDTNVFYCPFFSVVTVNDIAELMQFVGGLLRSDSAMIIDFTYLTELQLTKLDLIDLSTLWSSKLPYKPRIPMPSAWVGCSEEVLEILSVWQVFFKEERPSINIAAVETLEEAVEWVGLSAPLQLSTLQSWQMEEKP